MTAPAGEVETVQRLVLLILVAGLVATGAELVLIEHYESSWQVLPIALIAAALGAIAWQLAAPNAASFRTLQAMMVLCLVTGAIGAVLHFRGASEFQREIDPSMARWPLIRKVMRAKTPPVLAPGLMTQLGLLGLVYTYKRSRS